MTHHYTVLFGGTVLTFDGALPTDAATRAAGDAGVPDAAGRRATAICYAHERILAVGSDEEILALAGPDSTVVDLRGRAVLPGFVEPHAHPYWEGLVAGMALLAGPRAARRRMRAVPGAASTSARTPGWSPATTRRAGTAPTTRPATTWTGPCRTGRSCWPTSRGTP